MKDVTNLIEKVQMLRNLSDNREVNTLASLFIEYLREQHDVSKKELGFSVEKKDEKA